MTHAQAQKQQQRAVRTRRVILEAAASVFEERGFQAATITEMVDRADGLTRGALYFHFETKEAIADALLALQDEVMTPPQNDIHLQALIDLTLAFAELLRTDTLMRAVVRLTVEAGPYKAPTNYQSAADAANYLLTLGKANGELLPTVEPERLTHLLQSTFTGLQILEQARSGREDLPRRVARMWELFLPSIAHPATMPLLSTDPARGPALLARNTAAEGSVQ